MNDSQQKAGSPISQDPHSILEKIVMQVLDQLQISGVEIESIGSIVIRPAPTKTVRKVVCDYVNDNGYLSSSKIADQLESQIQTKSSEPRRVILSTISSLIRERILEKNQVGQISLVRKEEAVTQ